MAPTNSYRFPGTKCPACRGPLVRHKMCKNTEVFGFHHPRRVSLCSMRCGTRGCRAVYGPNWVWTRGKKFTKRNLLGLKDFRSDPRRPPRPLFVNNKVGFDLDFLEYHLSLLFRNGTGWKGTAYAMSKVYPFKHHPDRWVKAMSDAMRYYLMIKELEPLNLHQNINIGTVGNLNITKYRDHIQTKVFPKAAPQASVIVLDGHSKVP